MRGGTKGYFKKITDKYNRIVQAYYIKKGDFNGKSSK